MKIERMKRLGKNFSKLELTADVSGRDETNLKSITNKMAVNLNMLIRS